MAVRVLAGPAGSGKTTAILKSFMQHTPSEHQFHARIVLPTLRQVLDVKRVLLDTPEFPGFFGDPVCTFFGLANEFLERAGVSTDRSLSHLQINMILEEIIKTTDQGMMPSIQHDTLVRTIRTMQEEGVSPYDHENIGVTDIADIYEDYLERTSCIDGVVRYGLESIKNDTYLLGGLKHVFLDGFIEFSDIQREFIRFLAEHCDVTTTVDYEEDRAEIYAASEPAFRFLMSLPCAESVFSSHTADVHAALSHIKMNFLKENPVRIKPDESVTMLVGTDSDSEVEMVAEEIGRLIRKKGLNYNDVLIATPYASYQRECIDSVFTGCRIPVNGQFRTLGQSETVRIIILCLRAAVDGWKPEYILDILRSPRLGGTSEDVMSINRELMSDPVPVERKRWFESWSADDETSSARKRLLGPVLRFDKEMNSADNTAGYMDALARLVSSFSLPEDMKQLRSFNNDWAAIKRVMLNIASSEDFLDKKIGLRDFVRLFEQGIDSCSLRLQNTCADGILLTTLNSPKLREYRVVFILGMMDEVFPTLSIENDSELDAIEPRDTLAFFSTVCKAKDMLYLCRSEADVLNEEVDPSPILEEVQNLFSTQIRCIEGSEENDVPCIETDSADFGLSIVSDGASSTSENRVYSIEELETFSQCPFRHFCLYELGVSSGEKTDRDMIAYVLSRLYSAIYVNGRKTDLAFDDAAVRALKFLRDYIEESGVLSGKSDDEKRLGRKILEDTLLRFLQMDMKWIDESGFVPKYFNLGFGLDPTSDIDEKSTDSTLTVNLGDGSKAEVSGRIDRVDMSPNGWAIAVSYLPGYPLNLSEIAYRTHLRPPVYASALRSLFRISPTGAEFRVIQKPIRVGIYSNTAHKPDGGWALSSSSERFSEELQDGLQIAAACIKCQAEKEIEAVPESVCPSCGYKDICPVYTPERSE